MSQSQLSWAVKPANSSLWPSNRACRVEMKRLLPKRRGLGQKIVGAVFNQVQGNPGLYQT